MRRSTILLVLPALVALSGPPTGAAPPHAYPPGDTGAVQFRLGGFFLEGEGSFWDDVESSFTLDPADLDDLTLGFTFLVPMSPSLAIGMNVDYFNSTALSAVRGVRDPQGRLILHDTRLRMLPLVADFRLYPGGRVAVRGSRGQYSVRRPSFYFGGGIGVNFWEYEEFGDFLDRGTGEIFFEDFRDDGASFAAHALAGLQLPVGHDWSLLFEGRYFWSEGDLGQDFAGLGTIDFDGASAFVGFSVDF